jgi:1,4-alpha-glucan branching enzyme
VWFCLFNEKIPIMKTSQPLLITRKSPIRKNELKGNNEESQNTASPPNGSKAVEVIFSFDHPDAKEVFLCGDFNQWALKSLRMIRRDEAPLWEKRLTLMPGRYEYRFVVDGQWMSDPQAPSKVSNPYGSINSIVEVKP